MAAGAVSHCQASALNFVLFWAYLQFRSLFNLCQYSYGTNLAFCGLKLSFCHCGAKPVPLWGLSLHHIGDKPGVTKPKHHTYRKKMKSDLNCRNAYSYTCNVILEYNRDNLR